MLNLAGARRFGMDRAGAEAELDRRQGTTGKHLQGGQPLSALAARGRGDPASQADGLTRRAWLAELMARRPVKVAAIALANKIARIAWALMVRGTRYREPVPQAT
jgi:hypothetical protein